MAHAYQPTLRKAVSSEFEARLGYLAGFKKKGVKKEGGGPKAGGHICFFKKWQKQSWMSDWQENKGQATAELRDPPRDMRLQGWPSPVTLRLLSLLVNNC